MKLNDIRVLKNILGDKYKEGEETEFTLPKYDPKKLNWDAWSMNMEEKKKKVVDLTKNSKGYVGAVVKDVGATPKDAWGVRPDYDVAEKQSAINILTRKGIDLSATQNKEPSRGLQDIRAQLEPAWGVRPTQTLSPRESKELIKASFGYDVDAAELEDLKREAQRKRLEADIIKAGRDIKGPPAREKDFKEKMPKEMTPQQQELARMKEERQLLDARRLAEKSQLDWQKFILEKRQTDWQLAEARRKQDEQRGLIKFEQSPIGQFLKGPLVKTAGRVSENIGQNLGGSILGPFSEAGASTKLRNAITYKNAYLGLLTKRYANKSPPVTIRGEADIMAIGTAGEKKRLIELNNAIQRAQAGVASTGFLSGTGGQQILGRVRRGASPDLQRFTQVGYSGGNLGTFGPEALGRLGVTQGLTAIRPENKWDLLLGRGGVSNDRVGQLLGYKPSGVSADRITFLLGKQPDPLGQINKLKKWL